MNFKNGLRLICVLVLLSTAGCNTVKRPFRLGKKSVFATKSAEKDSRSKRGIAGKPQLKVTAPTGMISQSDSSVYRLKQGDQIRVFLRSIPEEEEIEDIVDDNGNITLAYIDLVHVEGKTASEIERLIQQTYLEQKIYKLITVNVVIPAQRYFVRGEVRKPGQFQIISGTSLVQAIAAAGGYTEYANPKKVRIIRGESTLIRNVKELEKHPEKDEVLVVGDVIVVPRSAF